MNPLSIYSLTLHSSPLNFFLSSDLLSPVCLTARLSASVRQLIKSQRVQNKLGIVFEKEKDKSQRKDFIFASAKVCTHTHKHTHTRTHMLLQACYGCKEVVLQSLNVSNMQRPTEKHHSLTHIHIQTDREIFLHFHFYLYILNHTKRP